jgi:RNA polymerase sigma factor (sigma-70 family)
MQFFSLFKSEGKLDGNAPVFSEVKDYLQTYLTKLGADREEVATAMALVADRKRAHEKHPLDYWEKLAQRTFKVLRIPIASEKDLKKSNFGLTQAEFTTLLAELRSGKGQQLFEQVFLTHFEQCKRYIRSVYAMDEQDAYDLTMDTLIDFRRLLIETDQYFYKNLCYVFTLKAVQSFLRKKRQGQKDNIQFVPFEVLEEYVEEEEEMEFEEEEMLRMEAALDNMCDDCKEVLKTHYYEGKKLKDMATQNGVTPNNMRQRKSYCIKKLRNFYFKHQVSLEEMKKNE